MFLFFHCFHSLLCTHLFLATVLPTEVDLVFAMSPVSAASNQSFQLMRDTVKSIVDSYGASVIHYSVVLYGAAVAPMLTFAHKKITEEEIKELIDGIPQTKGKKT